MMITLIKLEQRKKTIQVDPERGRIMLSATTIVDNKGIFLLSVHQQLFWRLEQPKQEPPANQ